MFKLEFEAPNSRARAGRLQLRGKSIETPIFMPVGTQATVKGLSVENLEEAGSQILLANTYHLLLRPGPEVFTHIGGIHKFMNWKGGVLTDSGGFQIFSLANDRIITEEGAHFRSYIDGREIFLSPELSIETQKAIRSDIMMVLDQCIPSTASHAEAVQAMHLTHRWARRSLEARGESEQALFGIVQGACFEDLRRESARVLTEMPFDGFAIGGLAVGETKSQREDFTELTAELLPREFPRYLMGVGTPIDLLEAVHRGVDMFDCIIPSALAKQGVAFTNAGRIDLYRGVYKLADDRLDPQCPCITCRDYSRAYLHHLIKTDELLGWQLITRHNLRFYHDLMAKMRRHILAGTFHELYREQRSLLEQRDPHYPPVTNKPGRRKREQLALERYEIRRADEGFYYIADRASGEKMHGGLDPDAESDELYVAQSRLTSRVAEAEAEPLVVWDVGLGAAHNAMAVVRAVEGMKEEAARPVKLISFENDLGSLRLALKNAGCFPHLQTAAPNVLLRSGSWKSPVARLEWTLMQGDFLTLLSEAPAPHIIFYDPFSWKTDHDLWTLNAFSKVFAACGHHDAELFTFAAGTAVRAAMLVSGFYLAAGMSTGSKRETTIALTPRAVDKAEDRKRELMGEAWFLRWGRSGARYPFALQESERANFDAKVGAHPQFAGITTKA